MTDIGLIATERIFAAVESLPFSFVYDGTSSRELLGNWQAQRVDESLDSQRCQTTLTYTDQKSGLEIRCEAIRYIDRHAVEWVIFFRNTGGADTGLLENIQALDVVLTREAAVRFAVHHAAGSDWNIADFAPTETRLGAGKSLQLGSELMSSIQALPFFNAEAGGEGVIGALGWSGTWKAGFSQATDRTLHVQAGMDATHLRLQPGEEIRTPRILLLSWQGDRIDAHNQWRRLLLEYYSPRPAGEPVQALLCAAAWGAQPEAAHMARIQWYADHDLPIECYWIDAGWSGKTGPFDSWMTECASRIVNPEHYPNGFKPISDAAHTHGMKFLLWHWPNRALPGVEIVAEHPDWLVMPGEGIDHGNPEVNRWLIESNSQRIADFGIDIYRQDGGPVYPVDTEPDRQGINQCRHFKGFYEFWDTLLERHPHLMIDNCAGGGRKIDLETIKRSVCLWRSDYQVDDPFDPIGMQGQTYGLSFWAPLSGGCARLTDAYNFRSAYSAAIVTGFIPDFVSPDEVAKTFDFDRARAELKTYLALRECFSGDYYPLTSYSVAADVWMAWQFDRPDLGCGFIQAFRRPESGYETARFKLRGLVAEANYEVTDIDEKQPRIMTGAELLGEGLHIAIAEKPGAVVISYRKLP